MGLRYGGPSDNRVFKYKVLKVEDLDTLQDELNKLGKDGREFDYCNEKLGIYIFRKIEFI